MSAESKLALGIETATKTCSVAVITRETVLAENEVDTENNHEPVLLPLIDRTLSECNIKPDMLSDIVVSAGPGSFTGLRIGIATARGLALALKKSLLFVPTLDGLSYNAGTNSGTVCPILDAHRGEIYTALYRYRNKKKSERKTPYMVITPEELVKKITETTVFIGDVDIRMLKKHLGKKATFVLPELNRPKAASIALLGSLQGSTCEPKPIYLRKTRAEEQLITIDEMKDEDIPKVMEIEKASFPKPWTEEMFRDRRNGIFLAARLRERVVGYAAGLIMHDELHIGNLAIHRDFRRRGIARKLLQKIINLAHTRDIKSLTLEVRARNYPAQNLYRKFGFEPAGRRRKYYQDTKEDAIIMNLKLKHRGLNPGGKC